MTFCAWVMLTVQVPVPEQPPPLQPVKVLPAAAVALSATLVPLLVLQDVPQLMPAGLLTTVPEPVPDLVTPSG